MAGGRETVDGATREREIDLKDKVQKALEAGASQASDATKADEGTGQQQSDADGQQQESTDQVVEDDAVEFETPSGRQTIRLSEVAKNPDARKALSEQLTRSHQPAKTVVDEEATRNHARRMQIEADIDRGLLRVNPQTGQLEETQLMQRFRQGSPEGGAQQRRTDDDDPLAYLTAEEKAEFETLTKKATDEGDSEALGKSQRLVMRAATRAGTASAKSVEQTIRREFQQRDQQNESTQIAMDNVRQVHDEMKKHPDVFGAYDPATGKFANERRAQIARNQVASTLQVLRSTKVDQRHLGAVAIVAAELRGGAPAPGNTGQDSSRQSRSAPPPATGKGSKIPPGPPPKPAGAAPNSKTADTTRPKFGTPGMIDAVTKRLQSI